MSVGQTTKGLPFPNGDDPVYQGDDRIKGLAIALDTSFVQDLSAAPPTAAAFGGAYPEGWSMMQLSAATASAGGWPVLGGPAVVLTFRKTASYVVQWCWRANVTGQTIAFTRILSAAFNGTWQSMAGPASFAIGVAAGIAVSGTPGNGSATVTLPAGLFPTSPSLFFAPRNNLYIASWTARSASSFTVQVRRADSAAGSGTVDLDWQAVIM